MKNALLPGLGGPMGRHARPVGVWFDPRPWVILLATGLFLLVVLRHVPCIQTGDEPVNTYIRLCYSDLPLQYVPQNEQALQPFSQGSLKAPPLVAALMTLAMVAARWLYPVGADGSGEVAGANAYFAISTVLLFVAFLVWALSAMLLGRDSKQGRYRSWDGLLIAGAPVVFASGLISWELVPIAVSSVALLLYARGKPAAAGVMFGLAAASGPLSIPVLMAVAAAAGLAAGWRPMLRVVLSAAASWLLVQSPLLVLAPELVAGYYRGLVESPVGYGSLWFVLQGFGVQIRDVGPLGYLLLVIYWLLALTVLYLRRRRPRVGSMIAVLLIPAILLGPSFSPQLGLWLWFALVLSRPYRWELAAMTVVELGYFAAVWGLLSGHLTYDDSVPNNLYYLALLLRIAVATVIVAESFLDIASPRRDALRRRPADDPLGGKLAAAAKPAEMAAA